MAVRIPLLLPASVFLSAAALAWVAATLPATAQDKSGELYQWKDAKGVTHYADAPPTAGQYQSRTIQHRDGTPAPTTPQPAATTAASANCSLARTNLERLQAGGDIGLDADGDGKPDAPLSAEERTRQTHLAEANIKNYCGAGAGADTGAGAA